MTTLKERIAAVEKLNQSRTKGSWYKDVSRSISSIHEGKRLKVTNQDWFEDKDKCVQHSDVDFMVSAPEMFEIITKQQEIIDIQNRKLEAIKSFCNSYADSLRLNEMANDFKNIASGCEEALEKTKQLMGE